MHPVLFRLSGVEVGTHDALVVVAAFAAFAVYAVAARRRGMLDVDHLLVATAALVAGAIAAKGGAAWRYALTTDDLSLMGVLAHGGKSILGGLFGAYAGALLAKRVLGIRHSTGDLFAPAVAVGMVIGRVGCYLTEHVGTATTLPWGVRLSPAAASQFPACPQCLTSAMHPSHLYEIAFHLMALAVLVGWGSRVAKQGATFTLYLLAYGTFRFVNEFVRGNPDLLIGLSGSQLFLLMTLPLLAWRIVADHRSGLLRAPDPATLRVAT